MKNKLYRFNRWLDKNETLKFILIFAYIAIGVCSIQFGNPIFGSIMMLICAFAMQRIFIGKIEFDRSGYDVPSVGEIVIVKKDFYYDGQFRKFINQSDPGQKPNWWKVPKGIQLVIVNVEETDGDWMITFEEQSRGNLHLHYLDTKDYWDTKSNIRSKILNKIGI